MTTSLAQPLAGTASAAPPWWRVGMVWLVVGGPAVVVVASLGTAVVAYVGADEVLVNTPSARHAPVQPTGTTPALIARNHAATAANPAANPAPNPAANPTAGPAAVATPAPR
jgi:hypothetical protein